MSLYVKFGSNEADTGSYVHGLIDALYKRVQLLPEGDEVLLSDLHDILLILEENPGIHLNSDELETMPALLMSSLATCQTGLARTSDAKLVRPKPPPSRTLTSRLAAPPCM